MASTFSVVAKTAAHTALRDSIDAGGNAKVKIYNDSDDLLAEVIMAAGNVDGGTGVLEYLMDTRDESAAQSGTANYCLLTNNAGTEYLRLDAVASFDPVANNLAMSTLAIAAGSPVEVTNITIGE